MMTLTSAVTPPPLPRLLAGLPAPLRGGAEAAAELGRELALPTFAVGGSVRDALLGRPSRDLDLVVEGDALGLARRLADRLGATVEVHPTFLTAEIRLPGGLRLDVAAARRERYPVPAALPEIEPADLAADLERRDFTVNAMALALAAAGREDRSALIDPFEGRADLERGRLRGLHPATFFDDPTRALRGVRLEDELGLRFEPTTLGWLAEALAAGALVALSGARLRRELELLFGRAEGPASTRWRLERCRELGLLAAIDPALGAAASGDSGRRLAGLLAELARPRRPAGAGRYLLALAAVLTPVDRERLGRRLGLGASEGRDPRLDEWSRAPERAAELAELARVDGPPSRLVTVAERMTEDEVALAKALADEPARQRLRKARRRARDLVVGIDGNDLLALGVPPGPRIGELLGRLRRARIDGEVTAAGERDFVRGLL